MQPAVVILPKKEDLLAILKDKLLPAAAAVPPPPAPIAISGAPLSVTTTPVVPTVPVVSHTSIQLKYCPVRFLDDLHNLGACCHVTLSK